METPKTLIEEHFTWYLDELQAGGFISGYLFHPETFELNDAHYYNVSTPRKRGDGVITKSYSLIPIFHYTPDFKVFWTPLGVNRFCKDLFNPSMDRTKPFFAQGSLLDLTDQVSWIDTKSVVCAKFAKQEGIYKFPMKQMLMWDRHQIFINKTIVPTIFKNTFTPQRYLFTDVSMKPRKGKAVDYDIRSLFQYTTPITTNG